VVLAWLFDRVTCHDHVPRELLAQHRGHLGVDVARTRGASPQARVILRAKCPALLLVEVERGVLGAAGTSLYSIDAHISRLLNVRGREENATYNVLLKVGYWRDGSVDDRAVGGLSSAHKLAKVLAVCRAQHALGVGVVAAVDGGAECSVLLGSILVGRLGITRRCESGARVAVATRERHGRGGRGPGRRRRGGRRRGRGGRATRGYSGLELLDVGARRVGGVEIGGPVVVVQLLVVLGHVAVGGTERVLEHVVGRVAVVVKVGVALAAQQRRRRRRAAVRIALGEPAEQHLVAERAGLEQRVVGEQLRHGGRLLAGGEHHVVEEVGALERRRERVRIELDVVRVLMEAQRLLRVRNHNVEEVARRKDRSPGVLERAGHRKEDGEGGGRRWWWLMMNCRGRGGLVCGIGEEGQRVKRARRHADSDTRSEKGRGGGGALAQGMRSE